MKSVLLDLGLFQIHWYGMMMALAFVAGLLNLMRLGRTRGYSTAFCSDLVFWGLIAGIVGARTAYVLEHWHEYAADPVSILAIQRGGLIFYGGLIGSAAAIVVIARLRNKPLTALLDFSLTSVPLAHAIGRVGCFLNGCCFGTRSDGPLGVCFPRYSGAWSAQLYEGALTQYDLRSLPVHPVQLYEGAVNLVVYALLVWVYTRRRWDGRVVATYMIAYPIARFGLEVFRGDRGERLSVSGFSIAQILSVIILLTGIALVALSRRTRQQADSS